METLIIILIVAMIANVFVAIWGTVKNNRCLDSLTMLQQEIKTLKGAIKQRDEVIAQLNKRNDVLQVTAHQHWNENSRLRAVIEDIKS